MAEMGNVNERDNKLRVTWMERSLILLKPDALERRLAGEMIGRFEKRGFKITAMKMIHFTPELARRHYARLADEPFFPEILAYVTRCPIIALILAGPEDTVTVIRNMVGVTDGKKAQPGTIRGDFTLSYRENLIHASDSVESAEREISIFFRDDEIMD